MVTIRTCAPNVDAKIFDAQAEVQSAVGNYPNLQHLDYEKSEVIFP